ncbi:membrane protein, putative [Oceanicola granulosus HTCC2516]|uniref:Membrane protein, putative n=1 Tax=Oceanicola granulosus (strain ATCC BAA-861 / DSM 15982 / KCTC 12143 / HTCC2516) TaxID=314256 RepID=Q2CCN7_OCEGH|nr:DUF3429 domain-containing protein [Oceanicola granulosus]EAR50476.1 membrane protein, putative [Oceanicola granulosus HTCC2516]
MTRPPASALLLGLAGLLPFLWGAATVLWPGLGLWSAETLGGRFAGPYLQLFYGTIILAFMSGVLWGFATRAEGPRAAAGYALSVIPALWAFFTTGGGPTSAATSLAVGFLALLLLDAQFARWGLAPAWWMPLRTGLTAVVVLCLLPVIL